MRLDRDQVFDQNGNLVEEVVVERHEDPLDAAGVIATLNAVLGVWSLDDASNAVRLPPERLVAEAEAWAAAAP
jgi:hypothetical protein